MRRLAARPSYQFIRHDANRTQCGPALSSGIGRALAEQFLQAGDSVCVTSRSLTTVTLTVSELRAKYARRGVTVCGTPCDVRRPEDVRNLRLFAEQEMGGVDVWINNAGSNGYVFTDLVQTSPATIKASGCAQGTRGVVRKATHKRTLRTETFSHKFGCICIWIQ